MALLLIGSTGNGKSAFGNFLIDASEDHIFHNQTFEVARANKPQTQYIAKQSLLKRMRTAPSASVENLADIEESTCRSPKYSPTVSHREPRSRCQPHPSKIHELLHLTVIDTPGLNEGDTGDLKHMIEIIECLQEVGDVLACALVIRFNTKIDAQYKATVKYYSKLLPTLFEKNVFIVMTDFKTDERTELEREMLHIDVENIKKDTIREVVSCASLTYHPTLFAINSLPLDDEERKVSLRVRDAFLNKMSSLKPFRPGALRVAKTAFMKTKDLEEIKSYEGEITGYNKRLQEANQQAKVVLQQMQDKEQEITDQRRRLKCLQAELKDKDSSDTVVANSWSLSKEWKFLRRLSKEFNVQSRWKIVNIERWTNGHCEWKEFKQVGNSVSGKLEGEFMRGLYASLTLETSKRIKYREEIDSLQEKIGNIRILLDTLTKQLRDNRNLHREFEEEMRLLEEFIEKNRKMIVSFSSDYMSLDEAQERLKSFTN